MLLSDDELAGGCVACAGVACAGVVTGGAAGGGVCGGVCAEINATSRPAELNVRSGIGLISFSTPTDFTLKPWTTAMGPRFRAFSGTFSRRDPGVDFLENRLAQRRALDHIMRPGLFKHLARLVQAAIPLATVQRGEIGGA